MVIVYYFPAMHNGISITAVLLIHPLAFSCCSGDGSARQASRGSHGLRPPS
jgi:hypothetical protein